MHSRDVMLLWKNTSRNYYSCDQDENSLGLCFKSMYLTLIVAIFTSNFIFSMFKSFHTCRNINISNQCRPHTTLQTRGLHFYMLYFTRRSPCSAVSWLWTIRIWSVSFIVHWCRTSILTFPNSRIGKNSYDQGAILFLQIWCGCDTILVFFVCLRQISI